MELILGSEPYLEMCIKSLGSLPKIGDQNLPTFGLFRQSLNREYLWKKQDKHNRKMILQTTKGPLYSPNIS